MVSPEKVCLIYRTAQTFRVLANAREAKILGELRGVLYDAGTFSKVKTLLDEWNLLKVLEPFLDEAKRFEVVKSYLDEFLRRKEYSLRELLHLRMNVQDLKREGFSGKKLEDILEYIVAAKLYYDPFETGLDSWEGPYLLAMATSDEKALKEVLEGWIDNRHYPDTTSGEVMADVYRTFLEEMEWTSSSALYADYDEAFVSPRSAKGFSEVLVQGSTHRFSPEDLDTEAEYEDYEFGSGRDNFARFVMVNTPTGAFEIDLF